jgi:hypothetical protein
MGRVFAVSGQRRQTECAQRPNAPALPSPAVREKDPGIIVRGIARIVVRNVARVVARIRARIVIAGMPMGPPMRVVVMRMTIIGVRRSMASDRK